MVATRERTRGRAVLELADPDQPDQRFTLWPGLPPPEGPLHPSLAPRILSGRVQGEPIWLEGRPRGAPLNRLGALLTPFHVALVLLDCCDGLVALHEAERVHGNVKSKRVVLGEGGYATLVGVSQRQAHPEEDLAALIRLGRTLAGTNSGLLLPEVAPASTEALRDLLAEHLEGHDEEELRDELAVIAAGEVSSIPQEPTELRILVEHFRGTRGRMDELSPPLGPETESTGSQISWSGSAGSAGEVTREAPHEPTQAVNEGTGALPTHGDHLGRRTQLLARILAPLDHAASPARFHGNEGHPADGVRALLLEGLPDPLPFAGAIPGRMRAFSDRPLPARDVSVTQVFRDRGTLVEVEPTAPPSATRRWRRPLLGLAALLCAFAVGIVVGFVLLYLLGSP